MTSLRFFLLELFLLELWFLPIFELANIKHVLFL